MFDYSYLSVFLSLYLVLVKLLRKTSVSNIKDRRANSSIFCETEIESEKKEKLIPPPHASRIG